MVQPNSNQINLQFPNPIPAAQSNADRINLQFSDTNPVNPFVVGFPPDFAVSPTTTTKPPSQGVNLLQIVQMKRNNVSRNIINSMIADGK